MPVPNHHVLSYYQSPAFPIDADRRARKNYDAAHGWLRMAFEQLKESYAKFATPTLEPLRLSQFIDGPLSIEQLVAMIRTYAKMLSTLLA